MNFRFLTALIAMVAQAFSCASGQPQALIDVGDHKLAILRIGSGQPTVVLEDGGGGSIDSWSVIQPRIGEFTSVVAYSRAGRGASEAAKSPRTLMAVVGELRTLLHRSGAKPPYVLVGRSIGGIYVRAFAMKHPSEVAGLVLVDASHERQGIEFARASGITLEDYMKMARSSVKGEAMRREMEGLESVMISGDLGIATKLPDIPLVVITNTRPDGPPAVLKAWRSLQEEVFSTTTQGMHIVTPRSGHDVAGRDPELVISAVRTVVDAARRNLP
jgi:pimeloyl-ACP methyl ester carboxylesterase